MTDRIRVAASESGCWQVMRGEYVLDIYPPHMWRHAYNEARREAIYQNLGVIGMEFPRIWPVGVRSAKEYLSMSASAFEIAHSDHNKEKA